MRDAWRTFSAGDVPPELVKPTSVALSALFARIDARERSADPLASIDVSYASNDLALRYEPVTEIDTIRFELWARRAIVDASVGSIGGVRSDQVTLEWIRDRIAHTLDPVTRTRIDTLVRDLGTAVVDGDLEVAHQTAIELRGVMSRVVSLASLGVG